MSSIHTYGSELDMWVISSILFLGFLLLLSSLFWLFLCCFYFVIDFVAFTIAFSILSNNRHPGPLPSCRVIIAAALKNCVLFYSLLPLVAWVGMCYWSLLYSACMHVVVRVLGSASGDGTADIPLLIDRVPGWRHGTDQQRRGCSNMSSRAACSLTASPT